MTSIRHRDPYSVNELQKLYPKDLELQLVQILFRHGERTPLTARFQNTGLAPFWPYCSITRQMISSVLEASEDNHQWSTLQWKRQFETFGQNDASIPSTGPRGEADSICNMGELTDKGRITTYNLGQRLRHLYIDQLKFMPPTLENTDKIYLRATPIPRALESLQQVFRGMYPVSKRASDLPPVTINTRIEANEILSPNDRHCKRFRQLTKAFAQRAADRWNKTTEMDYLNKLLSNWMPEDSERVAVDSHPRLSGILDTINSTLAHGPNTMLPDAFYDPRGNEIMHKIVVEEWFGGYEDSQEYRSLGIGSLMGDLVDRMVNNIKSQSELCKELSVTDKKACKKNIKLALSGCHDTTLAGILSSLGGFKNRPWPPYTSHIAFELFRKPIKDNGDHDGNISSKPAVTAAMSSRDSEELDKFDRSKFNDYYVRLRYNDEVITIPGCAKSGNHLEGDESLCTLEAFKKIVDKYVPGSWKKACNSNIDASAFPEMKEPAGY
ncbi:hypothetical protein K3495_g6484 [Podosphaera aphanis]|nr:hypothetical protein K3495_g6484 [Podosphaera aphanis]